ncbi:MAG: SPFH domain-containing protein [Planctomycetota bacterium]
MKNFLWPKRSRAARVREFLLGLLLGAGLIYFGIRKLAGDGGVAQIADTQIAVVSDHLSGRTSVITSPGVHLFLPWFQEVNRFDKSPIEYRMEGTATADAQRVPRLVVRADDGSSFWFETFSLHYAILPERGAELLADSGGGEGFKTTLVNAFARSVLRDEFGRYSAEDIVEPDNLHTATRRSQERLNELLAPHSLVVLEITTPKPRFDSAYELAIERRKIADQMIQHQRSKRVQLEQEKLQLEERARKEKEIERRKLETDLAQQRLAAERDSIRIRTDADIFYREQIQAATLAKTQKEQQALALSERYRLDAAGLVARLAELEVRGESVVRAALIEKLRSIEISIVPYTRDSSPQRTEVEPQSTLLKGKS